MTRLTTYVIPDDYRVTRLEHISQNPDVVRLAATLRERSGIRLEVEEPVRRAAVALILRLRTGESKETLEILLIKRAAWEGDPWSGHVAFPGGRQEAGDATAERTAIREAWEETGIELDRDGQILGCLDELQPRTPVLPPIVITPFVAIVREDVEVVTSPEVAEAFWVPVETLRDPEISREVVLDLEGTSRAVSSFQHRDHTIWGLTERIIRQFLSVVAGERM